MTGVLPVADAIMAVATPRGATKGMRAVTTVRRVPATTAEHTASRVIAGPHAHAGVGSFCYHAYPRDSSALTVSNDRSMALQLFDVNREMAKDA